ncbi:MAG: FHA domain-containing protein [Anaeromyxobacteraceae bacterium]
MKSARTVQIADHLWAALDRMAEEMGSDREALLNQAIHVLARLNGYVVPGPAFREIPTGPHPTEPERRAVAEQVLETAARLERAMQAPPPVPVTGTASLVVVREDGTEELVSKERFVIGRGRHCDLVVDSGKVSREHAVLVRENGGWFIEDLGSSNGTWFRKERIQRRRIEDGDEYFVCSEKLRCQLR